MAFELIPAARHHQLSSATPPANAEVPEYPHSPGWTPRQPRQIFIEGKIAPLVKTKKTSFDSKTRPNASEKLTGSFFSLFWYLSLFILYEVFFSPVLVAGEGRKESLPVVLAQVSRRQGPGSGV